MQLDSQRNQSRFISTYMNTSLQINTNLRIKTSKSVRDQLMVCSHERSGTHFTMNTIDFATEYCSSPWLNYDLNPLGARLNFFSPTSVGSFIKDLSELKVNNSSACNVSILKSHFPVSHLGDDASKLPLKIIYIWREPAETIASLWKYMHRWNWNEGPKTESPLELATTKPSGQSQRYQASNYKDYFERWAAHVIDGLDQCKKNPKAQSISYRKLLMDHEATTKSLCRELDIEILHKPQPPSKSVNTIKGADLSLHSDTMARLRDLCNERLEEFPDLKAHIDAA